MQFYDDMDAAAGARGDGGLSLDDIKCRLRTFAAERDWDQFHTPRNLIMALVGEVGELAECFQWRGEVRKGLPEFTAEDKAHVGEELSDCLMYLCRLADMCDVDLSDAVINKMNKNALKYPADKAKGSSAKYHVYSAEPSATAPSGP